MIIIKWAVLAIACIAMNFVAFAASPFLSAASVLLRRTTFPAPLSWLYSHDHDLDGWRAQWPELADSKPGVALLWWRRMAWICRNPAYGFAAHVAGLPVAGTRVESVAGPTGWTNTFRDQSGRKTGFGYRRLTDKWDIWLGWASPSHDGKTFMLKVKVRRV